MSVSDETLTAELSDGRSISAPLAWYPRLLHGSTEERHRWRLIGQGMGIHWPDLDEDISLQNLLDGRPSGESQRSLRAWLDQRSVQSGATRPVQSFLPENLEPLTISSLMDGETAYVVPWTIVADEEGKVWIDGTSPFGQEPRGTSCVKITRSGSFILVDGSTIVDRTYTRVPLRPGERLLPVIFQ